MKRYDIFISYRRVDGAQYARIIQLLLENSGYSVFLDYEELRDGKFGEIIEQAIKDAPIFILILTKKYLTKCWRKSDWVRKEILTAIQHNKKIIPIVPDNMPIQVPLLTNRKIKHLLNTEQYSFIDFGKQLNENVRTMIADRIEQVIGLNIDMFNNISYSKILPFVMDENNHPINFVKYDTTTGTVSQPFTSLIIGFDNIGEEIFKFIYEFSSFISPNKQRCKFKCYAIDENMDKRTGILRAKMPAIGDEELSLIHAPINSENFWSIIMEILKDLNYIVISLDDTNTSFSLMSQLYNVCRKNNKHDIGIFIKCKNHRIRHDILKQNELMGNHIIHPFVVDSSNDYESILINKAKEFHHIFNQTVSHSASTVDEDWEESYGEKGILRKCKNMSYYDAIIDTNRAISGLISSILNSYTMRILLGINEGLDIQYSFYALQNMARMEHERWVSALKISGYTYGENHDKINKKSKFLGCSWEEMDETFKKFDYIAAETIIKMTIPSN